MQFGGKKYKKPNVCPYGQKLTSYRADISTVISDGDGFFHRQRIYVLSGTVPISETLIRKGFHWGTISTVKTFQLID